MIKAALLNYFRYFLKFFKGFFILGFSIFIVYLVFQFIIVMPFKNSDIENYKSFIEQINLYISTINTDELFSSGFLSEILKDIYTIFSDASANMSLGTIIIIISVLILGTAYVYVQVDCKRAIKEDLKNRDTAKIRVQILVKTILNLVFAVLIFIITLYWLWTIFFLPITIALFNALKCLLSDYFIYFRKYKIYKIVTIPNIFMLVITEAILMYFHTIIFFLISPHVSLYMLLLLALSSLAYTTCITDFTATKYLAMKRSQRQLS